MMAAEAGYAVAQFNVAYMCEQNSVSNRNVNLKCASISLNVIVTFLLTSALPLYLLLLCQ